VGRHGAMPAATVEDIAEREYYARDMDEEARVYHTMKPKMEQFSVEHGRFVQRIFSLYLRRCRDGMREDMFKNKFIQVIGGCGLDMT
jgi:hypothetical protein